MSQRGAAPISGRSVIADPVRRAGTLYRFLLEPWSLGVVEDKDKDKVRDKNKNKNKDEGEDEVEEVRTRSRLSEGPRPREEDAVLDSIGSFCPEGDPRGFRRHYSNSDILLYTYRYGTLSSITENDIR